MSRNSGETSSISLPTEATKPTKRWQDQKVLLLGQGKIGKSAWMAENPGALFLEFEPGLNHLAVKKVSCRSWDDVRQVYGLLLKAEQAGTFPYDTIVIDTLDMFLTRAAEEVVERAKEFYKPEVAAKINTIGDIPEGKGWWQHKELVRLTLDKLTQLPAALVCIGHVATKEIKEPTRVIHKDTINIGGQVGTSFLHWADHTLHMKAMHRGDTIIRVVKTKPTETLEAGSRGDVVPDGFQLNGSMAENWEKFRKLFD